jgi:hypothetical protein
MDDEGQVQRGQRRVGGSVTGRVRKSVGRLGSSEPVQQSDIEGLDWQLATIGADVAGGRKARG